MSTCRTCSGVPSPGLLHDGLCFKCLAGAYDNLKLAENRDGAASADEWAEKVAGIQRVAGLPGSDKMKVWVATAIRAAIRQDQEKRKCGCPEQYSEDPAVRAACPACKGTGTITR